MTVGISRYVTDWITSRVGKSFWYNNDKHNGFAIVDFEQLIHYLCMRFLLVEFVEENKFRNI
ncbi:hypothetical protein [Capnocytophaga canimorsus]|uniref:hypothetical protein n=1 Tax=Capnocytophaga canimorsus TaxID=28188 RepID=UPI00385E1CCA